jgi:fumarate reductase subunit D
MKEHRIAMGEVLVWFAFSGGGFVLALLVPIHILIQGILAPLGIFPSPTNRYDAFANALGNPLVKLYVFVLVALPIYNLAHRLRVILPHLGVKTGQRYHPVIFYGLAVIGTLVSAYLVLFAP